MGWLIARFVCPFAEDTINHLQCIRESVVQMKNTNAPNAYQGFINTGVSWFLVYHFEGFFQVS
jgi:hypothetical protein